MIRVIAVDDDRYNLEELCELLQGTEGIELVGRYDAPRAALAGLESARPEAAFIDIELPEMDGLTLAERMLEIDPGIKIVFVTGWNQYAVQAFEMNALDYLMKPLNPARFEKMIARLKSERAASAKGAKPTLSVRLFGGYEVRLNGKPVVWQRTKAEELFAYLITRHGTFVHKNALLDALWPDHPREKSLPMLQTSVYRLRNVFSGCEGRALLRYAGSRYGLFLEGVDCDYLALAGAIEGARAAEDAGLSALLSASKTFERGFLPESGYLWSDAREEELRRALSQALQRALSACEAAGHGEGALAALGRLAILNPDMEDCQRRYLTALLAAGRRDEAARYCARLEIVLTRDYDASLPESIWALLYES